LVKATEQLRWSGRIAFSLTLLLLLSCTGQNGRSEILAASEAGVQEDVHLQADILFDTLNHDFGTIIEGEMVVCYFDYENTGKGDLVITSVEATCGCTIPDWNKEPLKPGERDQLKVVFNTRDRKGSQFKSVAVESNATNPVVRLTISANVISNK